jgi:hypothetical protein
VVGEMVDRRAMRKRCCSGEEEGSMVVVALDSALCTYEETVKSV